MKTPQVFEVGFKGFHMVILLVIILVLLDDLDPIPLLYLIENQNVWQ